VYVVLGRVTSIANDGEQRASKTRHGDPAACRRAAIQPKGDETARQCSVVLRARVGVICRSGSFPSNRRFIPKAVVDASGIVRHNWAIDAVRFRRPTGRIFRPVNSRVWPSTYIRTVGTSGPEAILLRAEVIGHGYSHRHDCRRRWSSGSVG
jgi:hypothetical protein